MEMTTHMGEAKRRRDRGETAPRTTKTTNTCTTHYTLSVLLRTGERAYRRFHSPVEVRAQHRLSDDQFAAWVLEKFGLRQEVADLAEVPVVEIRAFGDEASCKAHYDAMLALDPDASVDPHTIHASYTAPGGRA